MANIKVDTEILRHAVDNEKEIARQLDCIENEINRLITRLNGMSVASSGQMIQALHVSENGVASQKEKLYILAGALEQISRLYDKTETDAKNKGGESVKKSISDIISSIKDVGIRLGMDPSAAYSNDPVNLSNGNYVYEKTFLELNTILDMKFHIFYNVQSAGKGFLGRGWTHSFECSLRFQGEEVIFTGDDSSEKRFLKKEDGNYEAFQNQNGTLEETEDGYLMRDREGMFWYFDNQGRLLRQKDLIGNTNILSYDENGRLLKVWDPYYNSLSYFYDETGFLDSVADHTGRKVLLEYKKGLLTKVTAPEGRTISFRYDSESRLCEIINANGAVVLHNEYDARSRTIRQIFADGGNVRYNYLDENMQVEMTEQNGNTVLYEHDSAMRGVRTCYADSEESSEFNDQNQRVSYTDRRGNTTRYGYNDNGTLSDIITPLEDHFHLDYTPWNQLKGMSVNGKVLYRAVYNHRNLQESVENGCGGKVFFEYNEKGQLTACTQEDGSRISVRYDEAGNVSAIIDPMGGCTSYIYDELHRVTAAIDPKGQKTSYIYNEANELIEVCNAEGNHRTYQYDACGNMVCFTDYNGAVTELTYNDVNRVTSVTDPDGSVTKYEYDAMWNLEREIAPDGGMVTYEYDQLHHMVGITGADGNKEHADYDACGNVIRRIDASGAEHQIRYDALNRPIEVEDPNGRVMSARYDALGNVTQVTFADGSCEISEFDIMGNQISFTDRGGYRQAYQYDKSGNLTEIADKNGWLERFEYYPGGLLKKEVRAEGTCLEYQYDANQNIKQVLNQDELCWKFTYDSLDRLIRIANSEGFAEAYEYDPVGNVTAVIAADGSRTEYTYSPGGSLTGMTDACGNKTKFIYDVCHRLTEILQPEDDRIDVSQINEINRNQKHYRLTSYRYDQTGRMIRWIDPEGNETTYGYDACGRLSSRKDAEGNTAVCTYNPDGTEKSFVFSDGKSIQMQYNALRQLIEFKDWLGTTSIIPDKMGRPLAITDPEGNTMKYEWGERGERKGVSYPDGSSIRYEYDHALRLKKCYSGDDVFSYSYYDNGRLYQKTGPDGLFTTYSYNRSGQITGLCHGKGEMVLDEFTYQYDRNGRKSGIHCTRSGVSGGGNYEYRYNALGSLVSVLKDGTEEEQYQYDRFGNRIWSRIRGVETTYNYNKLDQLMALHRSCEERRYSYEKNGNSSCEWRNGNLFRRMQYDSMDRLALVETADRKEEYTYNGFGLRVSETVTGSMQCHRDFLYDITKDCRNLVSVRSGGSLTNYFWDDGLLGEADASGRSYYFCDPQMTPLRRSGQGQNNLALSYDSFGCLTGIQGSGKSALGYTGYHMVQGDGLTYAYQRDYEPETGRFLSRDPVMGAITVPLALNAYTYCMGDPVNRYDPTGAIVIPSWLAGGLVGAAAGLVSTAAGDIVNSVKNGKISVSSWQTYAGSVAGGFVSGTVFVASGANAAAAGAAGAAAETLITNGLNMWTGTEGYRREDGYTWKNLVADTAISGGVGATAGALFDKVSKATKFLKIPGITKGRNSYAAVFVTQIKRAAHSNGTIKNLSLKTLYKGLVAFGGIKFFDEILIKGWDAIQDTFKSKAGELVENLIDHLKNGDAAASVVNAQKYMSGSRVSAACPAAGG